MENPPETQLDAVIEALGLGADRKLAANSAGMEEMALYGVLNAGLREPESSYGVLRQRFLAAEAEGAAYRERVARMRKVVEQDEEAMQILKVRAAQFLVARQSQVGGDQLSMLKT